MKITGGILLFFIILVIIGVIMYLFLGSTISPRNIVIENITVSDTQIIMKGDDSMDSAIAYRGYRVTYNNGALYIKVKGSLAGILPSFLTKSFPFSISIDKNKYGTINEIYLQGDSPSENLLIWPKQ